MRNFRNLGDLECATDDLDSFGASHFLRKHRECIWQMQRVQLVATVGSKFSLVLQLGL